MSVKIFKSYNKFFKYYFPQLFEDNKINNMSPEEYGKYLANKSIKKVLKFLNKEQICLS